MIADFKVVSSDFLFMIALIFTVNPRTLRFNRDNTHFLVRGNLGNS